MRRSEVPLARTRDEQESGWGKPTRKRWAPGPLKPRSSGPSLISFRDSGVGGSHQTSTRNVQKTEGSCLQKEKPKPVGGPTATHRPQTIKRHWRQPARPRPELPAKPRRWTATFPRSLPRQRWRKMVAHPAPRHRATPPSPPPRALDYPGLAPHPDPQPPFLTDWPPTPPSEPGGHRRERQPPPAPLRRRRGWRTLTASRAGRPDWDSKEEEKGKEEKGGARKHWAAATATAAAPPPLSAEWAAQTAVAVYNYARCLMGRRQLLRLRAPSSCPFSGPRSCSLSSPHSGPPHIRASMILY